MDKYHIYEEIGKGAFSQVFKGREKKKIEYVAIKRIEKSAMNKIVGEVQVMHKLSSAHMLKFHDWYETRNNLWLILEYCTGGDLEALLRQDGHLPETSVRIFGLDILAGLKYLHTMGLIHCDIRPKNFLVDEYGILKLCDFKLTQKVPKEVLGDKSLDQRGNSTYMAPELFMSDGIFSFQSDFWAFGCMLYELRRGIPPFGEDPETMPLPAYVERLRTLDPVNNPLPLTEEQIERERERERESRSHSSSGAASSRDRGRGGSESKKDRNNNLSTAPTIPNITVELADLLQWLLEKMPENRCEWPALCEHPFWNPNNPTPPLPGTMPPQHLFDKLLREREAMRLSRLERDANVEYGVSSELLARAAEAKEAEYMEQHEQEQQSFDGDNSWVGGGSQQRRSNKIGNNNSFINNGGSSSGPTAPTATPIKKAPKSESTPLRGTANATKSTHSEAKAENEDNLSNTGVMSGKLKARLASSSSISSHRNNKNTNNASSVSSPVGRSPRGTPVVRSQQQQQQQGTPTGTPSSAHAGGVQSNTATPKIAQVQGQGPSSSGSAYAEAKGGGQEARDEEEADENSSDGFVLHSRGVGPPASTSGSASGRVTGPTPAAIAAGACDPLPEVVDGGTIVVSRGFADGADVTDAAATAAHLSAMTIVNGVSTGLTYKYSIPPSILEMVQPSALVSHSSDVQVKPIVGNKNIEVPEHISFRESVLPFPALSLDDVNELEQEALEQHLTLVHKALYKSFVTTNPHPAAATVQFIVFTPAIVSTLRDRTDILAYLHTISGNAEVANIVLNTHFLNLMIKLLKYSAVHSAGRTTQGTTSTTGGKASPGAAAGRGVGRSSSSRSPVGGSAATNAVISAGQAALIASRVMCATVLATMLRYASYIQPPPTRARDEHIIHTIVVMLKESGVGGYTGSGGNSSSNSNSNSAMKLDLKLKRQIVAALGEIIFYITAQDDSDMSSSSSSSSVQNTPPASPGMGSSSRPQEVPKWVLSAEAIDALMQCLRDNGDDVTQHYAAKTVENALAQGGLGYRCKFAQIEMAELLLHLALFGKSEGLQATCGTALAHMFKLVQDSEALKIGSAALKSAIYVPDVSLSSSSTTLSRVATIAAKEKAAAAAKAAPTLDPFQSSDAAAGAKFISLVLEKGGRSLGDLVEALKDSAPRLQQSLLTIIILVFQCSESSNAAGVVLRLARSFFLRSVSLLSQLLRLAEQGASSAVRGKALLTIQLLCSHSPILLTNLGEKRFPSLLVRALEPLFVQARAQQQQQQQLALQGLQEQQRNREVSLALTELSYFVKTALSMVLFLKKCSMDACVQLSSHIALLSDPSAILPQVQNGAAGASSSVVAKTAAAERDGRIDSVSSADGMSEITGGGGTDLDSVSVSSAARSRGGGSRSGNKGGGGGAEAAHRTPEKSSSGAGSPSKQSMMSGGRNRSIIGSNSNSIRATPPSTAPLRHHTPEALSASKRRSGSSAATPASPVRPKGDNNDAHHPASPSNKTQGNGGHIETVAGTNRDGPVSTRFDLDKLRDATDNLRAVVSVASQPSLRRLVLGSDGAFAAVLARAIEMLPNARAALPVLVQREITEKKSSNLSSVPIAASTTRDAAEEESESVAAFASAEHCALLALETVVQIDIIDLAVTATSTQERPLSAAALLELCGTGGDAAAVASGRQNKQKKAANAIDLCNFLVPTPLCVVHYIKCVSGLLVPAVAALSTHPEGDIRVVVASTMRRVLPSVLRVSYNFTGGLAGSAADHELSALLPVQRREQQHLLQASLLSDVASVCLRRSLAVLPVLLSDSAPIPQYSVKLLTDILSIGAESIGLNGQQAQLASDALKQAHAEAARDMLNAVMRELSSTGGLRTLINLWGQSHQYYLQQQGGGEMADQVGADSGADSVAFSAVDDQLVGLLRALCDCPNGVAQLIDAGICSSVSPAVSTAVLVAATATNSKTTTANGHMSHSVGLGSDPSRNLGLDEAYAPLFELLHLVLHCIIRDLAHAENTLAEAEAEPGTIVVGGERARNLSRLREECSEAQRRRELGLALRLLNPALMLISSSCVDGIDSAAPLAQRIHALLNSSSSSQPSMSSPSRARSAAVADEERQQLQYQLQATQDALIVNTHILDVATRSIGILFDLFPDVVTAHLLSKQDMVSLFDKTVGASLLRRQQTQQLSAAQVLSKILRGSRYHIPPKLHTRLLKILHGVASVAATAGQHSKARDLLSVDPLRSAIFHLAHETNENNASVTSKSNDPRLVMEETALAKVSAQLADVIRHKL